MGMLHYLKPYDGTVFDNCEHKEIKYTYKRGGGEKKCWSCYIEKEFMTKKETLCSIIDDDGCFKRMYINAVLYDFCDDPADYYTWGGRTRYVRCFNNALIAKGVEWFAYIKFYEVGDSVVKPLSAGKSGVIGAPRQTGGKKKGLPDIYFSKEPGHGPSRLFLSDTKLNVKWYMKYILVVPASTEKEALEFEADIMKNYLLFGS